MGIEILLLQTLLGVWLRLENKSHYKAADESPKLNNIRK